MKKKYSETYVKKLLTQIKNLKETNEVRKTNKAKETKGKTVGPWHVGQNYFIRTVTHHYTGKLVRVFKQELVLETAAWIADDGRFHEALAKGTLNEVEPMLGEVVIGRGSIVDASIWLHGLPTAVK
jgi:hypothetical protein